MMQLLVSIRSAFECRQVIDAGIDVIDLKEPLRGSLGAPDARTLQEVVALVAGRRPLSVALGEVLQDDRESSWADSRLPDEVQYAKYGLAGSATHPRWRETWAAALDLLPSTACPVAVAYVDRGPARCLPWRSILEAGADHRCGVLLLDTYDKTRGGLRRWVSDEELREVREATAARGVRLALAGSLQLDDLVPLSTIQPDLVAVRSAVCEGDRTGQISRSRLAEIREAVRECGVA